MVVLKETIKRIECLRPWLAVRQETFIASEARPDTIFDQMGGLAAI
jgi:hypothetical protein